MIWPTRPSLWGGPLHLWPEGPCIVGERGPLAELVSHRGVQRQEACGGSPPQAAPTPAPHSEGPGVGLGQAVLTNSQCPWGPMTPAKSLPRSPQDPWKANT